MFEIITIAAASSLTDAMKEIGPAFTKANPGVTVRFTFGSSGMLQQQVKQGAPIDVFVSASAKEVNALLRADDLLPETRADIASNRLALIAPAKSPLRDWSDLKSASVKRLSLSDPASVPSGRYARETLTKRGLWEPVRPKAVFGQNVRQTLAYVATGDADAGIVFVTDAISEKRVKVGTLAVPGTDHSPIRYPAAVTTRSRHTVAARRFVRFLKEKTAQDILRRFGFVAPDQTQ